MEKNENGIKVANDLLNPRLLSHQKHWSIEHERHFGCIFDWHQDNNLVADKFHQTNGWFYMQLSAKNQPQTHF